MKKKYFLILCFSFVLGLMLAMIPNINNNINKNTSQAMALAVANEDFSDEEISEEDETPKIFTLTLVLGHDLDNEIYEYEFNETLNLIAPEIEGHNFVGWFFEGTFINKFTETTMPEKNLILYANYEPKVFIVTFNPNNNDDPINKYVNFGETATPPSFQPINGFSFIGWFYDDGTFERQFDSTQAITENTSLIAKWERNIYTLEIVLGNGLANLTYNIAYEDMMTTPITPSFKNHNFVGWFADENLNNRFTFGKMPATNVKVYAGWKAKRNIEAKLEKQSYEFGESGAFFKDFSSHFGFTVEYLVNGKWTSKIPNSAGIYDVKVSRTEDAYYASFEEILKDGFELKYKELNLTWLIVLLFIICILELAAIIFIKKLKGMKTSRTFAIFPIVVGGNSIITNSQFTLIAISGTFALLGFIYLIYSLVDVHKTAKNEAFLPSRLDNRERFKDDLIFQNTNEGDSEYVSKPKTEQSFGEKYSAEDIKNLLKNDNFNKETLEKRKFNSENNSSINWNKVSETDGSDIIFKAKNIGSLRQGEYGGKTTTKFFEDDEDKK